MKSLFSIMICIVATLPLITGCAGSQPPLSFYQLTSAKLPAAANTETLPDLALGVGPITTPEILKREEIVVHGDGNQYYLSDLHRWAGLLEKDMTMVITENLSNQLGTQQVFSFPWGSYFEPDYRVTIDILSLAGRPGDKATLRAGWAIIDATGKQMLVRKISEYQHQTKDSSFNSLVQAENQVIALLCQEISSALRVLEKR
jgi:uncharacterized lipoprotein YmbA